MEAQIDTALGQLRAVPVQLSPDEPDGLLCVHSRHPNVDPSPNHFNVPTDTLKLTLVSRNGGIQWTKDLGESMVPGIWFCPVFPFDLDEDGTEEIWCTVNVDERDLIFTRDGYRVARLDPETGETTERIDWFEYPHTRCADNAFRNFLFGGHVDGEPVLVTAQGTYDYMQMVGWNQDLSRRWEYHVAEDDPGARGPHMSPILDVDGDGVDELVWGERLVDLDTGEELWCADRDTWHGHSDIHQPTLDRESGEWYVYTCREQDMDVSPRVVLYDAAGDRVWSDIDYGHMHAGWTARLRDDGQHLAMAGRSKNAPHEELDEYGWDAYSGEAYEFEYPVYSTLPVDIDGDGRHELVYREFGRGGRVIDRDGTVVGRIDANVARCQPSKFLDHPGEQVVTYTDHGTVRVWGDARASDTEDAIERYEHPYYRKAQRLSAVGYNWRNLGGL